MKALYFCCLALVIMTTAVSSFAESSLVREWCDQNPHLTFETRPTQENIPFFFPVAGEPTKIFYLRNGLVLTIDELHSRMSTDPEGVQIVLSINANELSSTSKEQVSRAMQELVRSFQARFSQRELRNRKLLFTDIVVGFSFFEVQFTVTDFDFMIKTVMESLAQLHVEKLNPSSKKPSDQCVGLFGVS